MDDATAQTDPKPVAAAPPAASPPQPATPPASPAPPAAAGPVEFTLDEWCNHHIGADKRHELIGGFRFEEMRAGRLKGIAADFVKRFEAFADRPAHEN